MRILLAFLFGGGLCVIGQLLVDLTKLTPARILTGMVVLGVILGGVGLYPVLVDAFGAGASVPLLGFGNLLAKGVREAINQDGPIGILTGGFKAGSAGLGAAVFFSMLAGIFGKSKS
ncbi:MAG: SpoVA/SpoVAEb family sporulation membrane protein [Clostridia bacterium]|nr:SpoVA/SpoVAEb family sporulation membrane protein [Clostridia bacterium]